MSDENESWLPNLVGGVSIWKLAPDLNEEQFFGGRLLVPETEGSDSLPVRVEWDLTGLVPLPEARAKHGERVEQAIGDFFACLERTAKVFEKGGSGYDRYKSAFTVPALDADGGAHYFFSPRDGQLKVINWGASPRKIRHDKHYLFGYQEFAALIRKEQEGGGAAIGAGALGAAVAAGASVEASAQGAPDGAGGASEGGEKDPKNDEKKDEGEEEKGTLWGKPWWMWVLYLVGLLFLLGLIFALLRDCQGAQGGSSGVDGGARAMDGAVASDGGIETPIYGHASDDGGPPATELHGDGGAGAGDGGAAADGGAGARADGGAAAVDAGRDGGPGSGGEGGGGEGGGGGSGGGGSGGGGSGGGGSGGGGSGGGGSGGEGSEAPPRNEDGEPIYGEVRTPSGGVVYWAPGEGGRAVQLPHRQYFHPDAQQWRIVGGTRKVYDYAGAGAHFRVFLRPGESFDGVRVQWRDGSGTWHDH